MLIYLVAVLALLGFAILVIVLLRSIPTSDEVEWARSTYLFGAVEALAFAAAGFLFGKEVHRQQAEKAEEKATNAEAKVEQIQAEDAQMRAGVRSVKKWVDTKVSSAGGPPAEAGFEAFGAGTPTPAPAEAPAGTKDWQDLKSLMDDMFPD